MAEIKAYSRFRNCFETVDENGAMFTVDDTPYAYVDLSDNTTYEVNSGDTWWTIADKVFAPLDYSFRLWWVIMDFQPTPYLDPTVMPPVGTVLYIPSVRTVTTKVLSPERRRYQ